jgi:hypothetical protein
MWEPAAVINPQRVMAGLGPATHVFVKSKESRGWRAKPGHDTGGCEPPLSVNLFGGWYNIPARDRAWKTKTEKIVTI